ncbi:hypothetical protein SAMN05428949_7210 [Chitinophaga sp. YR627]|uniref:hypothetical protein n=1 Tax=Chitinophaga sp. YR627 TaxID=1881041 RepID=UPI0008DF9C5D|nr:hypothetical protein [Chitinophaga sp. YR627]SFP04840.1 hypothetical protein SAMN05428949_7210 [Chitinophaga sp. YR627]
MKNVVLYMATAITLIFAACKKDKNNPPGDYVSQPKTVANLQGDWESVSFLTSNGWAPATEKINIAFSSNGLFVSPKMIYDTYKLEIVTYSNPAGDTVLSLSKAAQQDQTGSFFINRLTKDTLVLTSGFCLDFCSIKYVRVK